MATYRIKLSRKVEIIETAEVDLDLPCPPHPSDETVLEALENVEISWNEDDVGQSLVGAPKIVSVDGIADDEDGKEIVETTFD